MSVYTPATMGTFNVYTDDGVAFLTNQSDIPRALYHRLFSLGFLYKPVVLIVDIQDRHQPSYAIAQTNNSIDMNWVLSALSHFELGWFIEDGVLFSPVPSQVSTRMIAQMLSAKSEGLAVG